MEPENKPILEQKEKIEVKEQTKVEFKELQSYADAVTKKLPISVQFKEAGKLHSALIRKGAELKSTDEHSKFELKEGKMEFKASLTTDTNYAGVQTSYVAALSNYEQTPAELNDIYGPVIINQMNDETTTWNLLSKEDHSGDSAIRFRARTAANATAGFYAYGSTPGWDSSVTRRKYNLPFCTAYVEVEVEDEEIELSKSPGGIGDIYADEIKWSTLDLMTKINSDLLTTATAASEAQPYTFETTIITTGSLYGRDVTASGYTTLAAAGVDNMSSAPITLKKLRDMMDAVLKKGASKTDLVFIANHTQVTKIVTLLQSMQRIVPTSARIGFIGEPEIDGVPIFRDKDANTDDIWLIDLAYTKIGMKKAPSYVEFGKTKLTRKGIIWMMYNLFSTAPNHNYWIYGLQTT